MKRLLLMLAVVGLLLTPVLASAAVITTDRTTSQCWDTWVNFDRGSPIIPADWYTPEGFPTPVFQTYGDTPPEVLTLARVFEPGIIALTSGLEEEGITPQFAIKVFNYQGGDVKYIDFNIRYAANRSIESLAVEGLDYTTELVSSETVDNWTTAKYKITITPNPAFENIILTLGDTSDFWIDKICVSTECVFTPIPGSVLLLGTGIIGLVGIGIRRRSA